MVTFVSIETRRCAPLAALFCSSSHFFASACLLQPKIRRYFLHSILIWTLLQPTSSNYSHTYITSMAVTSSKFVKNSGELRHSFCGAFLCLLFAFLQVESVGRWVDRGQCDCSTHVAGYSPYHRLSILLHIISLHFLSQLCSRRENPDLEGKVVGSVQTTKVDRYNECDCVAHHNHRR